MAGNKKYKSGAKKAFITRRKAMQKLQVSLKDFRRLCILKGIYPVEPKNRSNVNNGSSQNKTFYHLSDIQYLSHEPILWKLWEFKTFMKRMSKARGRQDYEKMNMIKDNKPFYKLDHIVKERYPRFIDSLRDLDDALSMCFLYSRFSKTSALPLELIEVSKKLSVEFMHYVIETRSLRKVFVSIKGYYYQAEIKGQCVTWVVPHYFNIGSFHDVDFKVMRTFNEFYITLLGFVLYKLYGDSNLYYPPKIYSFISHENDNHQEVHDDMFEDVAALNHPILRNTVSAEDESVLDEFNEPELNDGNSLNVHEIVKFQRLFEGFKFFLNREVPRESLVFVIRSFGGTVSWDKLFSGATYGESNETITHQIVDRDNIPNKYINRYYIQPQWVFDCVNARKLLPVEDYFLGVTLPPHLSPFVEEKEGDYIPPEKRALDEGTSLRVEASSDSESTSDEADDDADEISEEAIDTKMIVRSGVPLKEKVKSVELEEKRLAEMMIPKKKRRLYDKIMFGKKRKLREVTKLKEKRKAIDAEIKRRKKQK